MCGIAGVFGRNDSNTVEQMLARFLHRGPDDGHAVAGKNYAFGARRLSIVGIADGRQPLSNEDETIWAAQNGELYNFPVKREEILANGHKLVTHCDTEMLPHLYEDYGLDFVKHIDGMFAVAIWDKTKQRGILARDRMGKKPLYYLQSGDSLYFASEIKSLLLVPGFERRINLEALSHFLSFKHVPCPLTIFEGIKMLPPAHTLEFRPGKEPIISRYWELDYSPCDTLADCSEDEIVDQLLAILRRGVKRRLMSDVPIGFFLSGGIDSSLSTAIAAEMSSDPIKTFTLTYSDNSTTDGKELDRKWARYTAEKYKTEHYEESVQFNHFPDQLRRVIGCFDEPFAGTTSTFFLAGLIAKHVKVAIAGDGADELFGSYLSHRLAQPLANFPQYKKTGDISLIKPFQQQTDMLERLYDADDSAWRAKLLVYSQEEKTSLLSKDITNAVGADVSEKRLQSDLAKCTSRDPLNRILEMEFKTIFADQVLAFVDRLSMAHSLEVRSAFLDTELVEFAAKLPGALKIKQGETKYLLKKAALRYFPEEMVFRKKEGFLMPITEWLSGDLEGYVRETLSASRLAKHGLFNQEKVNTLVDQLYAERCEYTHVNKVFALIVFQEWFDLYMQSTISTPACSATCVK